MKLFLNIFFLLCICSGCGNSNNENNFFIPEEEIQANAILEKTIRVLKDKYDLKPSGSGVAMPGGIIEQFFLSFKSYNRLNKKELIDLIIKSSQDFL